MATECNGKEKIIYSYEITNATKHDSPLLIPLLERIDDKIGNASGDKAYCSRENVQYVVDRGGKPYLMPKKNCRTLSKGYPAWKEMLYDKQIDDKKWLKHYHKRSNSEAVNNSFKKRIGSYLFSYKKKMQRNEVYLKVIVYNLRQLVMRLARIGKF